MGRGGEGKSDNVVAKSSVRSTRAANFPELCMDNSIAIWRTSFDICSTVGVAPFARANTSITTIIFAEAARLIFINVKWDRNIPRSPSN